MARTKPSQDSSNTARGLRGAWIAAGLVAVVLAGCGLLYDREAGQITGRQQDLEGVRVNLLAQLLRSELIAGFDGAFSNEIGRASCRERV